MFDFVAQFPIEDENAPIRSLQGEATDQARIMAFELGYAAAGAPSFKVLELPLGMYVECRMPVEEARFGGGNHDR